MPFAIVAFALAATNASLQYHRFHNDTYAVALQDSTIEDENGKAKKNILRAGTTVRLLKNGSEGKIMVQTSDKTCEGWANSGHFMPRGSRIRAHEFHYYDSEDNGADCIATKPSTGRNYPCIHVGESHWYGFPHLYYPSCPEFAERFVENAKKFSKSGKDML